MRPWVTWCVTHRMSWVVFAALIVGLPVCLLIGCYHGAVELAKEWARDWRSIQQAVKQLGANHD